MLRQDFRVRFPVSPLFWVVLMGLSWPVRGFAPTGHYEERHGHMPLYEHVFLARQDVSSQQVETMMKEYQQVIEEGGGKVGKTEYWGLKSLAFKIKKSRKAHYALMNLDAPPAAVVEMERRMSISPDVIRFLTIRVEAHETEQSVQMRKGDRDERRGDRDGERGGGFRGGERGGFRGGDRGGFRVAIVVIGRRCGGRAKTVAVLGPRAVRRSVRGRLLTPHHVVRGRRAAKVAWARRNSQ